MLLSPPALQPGDVVALVATARKISAVEIQPAVQLLEAWGLRPRLGATIGSEADQFAGTDHARRHDLQQALDDPQVRAVLCARGGYGTARLLDGLNFTAFRQAPKWVAGFSDITVLLSHLAAHTGYQSLHSTMPVLIGRPGHEAADETLRRLLFHEPVVYDAPPHRLNRPGHASGPLLGGNLSVIHALLGTPSDVSWDGAILFLEDLDEYYYHLDRMVGHLARTGRLARLAGLVIGHFSLLRDNQVPFGQSAAEIFAAHTAPYAYPVAFNFPAGHEPLNLAFRHGATARLVVPAAAASQLIYQ